MNEKVILLTHFIFSVFYHLFLNFILLLFFLIVFFTSSSHFLFSILFLFLFTTIISFILFIYLSCLIPLLLPVSISSILPARSRLLLPPHHHHLRHAYSPSPLISFASRFPSHPNTFVLSLYYFFCNTLTDFITFARH